MPRLESLDLNLFEFDFDLTMITFFLDADNHIYARYGGRDHQDAEGRQSLSGLEATMKSVLAMHASSSKLFVPTSKEPPVYVSDLTKGRRIGRGGGGCIHCHQVREILDSNLKQAGLFNHEVVQRYPTPDQLGIVLSVDESNVIARLTKDSPGEKSGLQIGDRVTKINEFPIHSFCDAQYALDHANKEGKLAITIQRDKQELSKELALAPGWKKVEYDWRPSLRRMLASLRLTGTDLTADEKSALGLKPTELAFKHADKISSQAQSAGIQAGDIILGIDQYPGDRKTMRDFLSYINQTYLVGEQASLHIVREGKRMDLKITFTR